METLQTGFVKTAIPDIEKMINNGTDAIDSFKYRPGLLEYEDYYYSQREDEVRREIIAELLKAKEILRKRKGWRWEMIKATNWNPIKLLFLFMAWRKNKKHGNRNRTNNKD